MSEPAEVLAGLIGLPAQRADDAHLENVAREVYRLLGAADQSRLRGMVKSWPRLGEDAEDLSQLAALAFVEAYRQGRIRPDTIAGAYTADSVSAYLWGICRRVFLQAIRRNRGHPVVISDTATSDSLIEATGGLGELLGGGPQDDDESRLWEILAAVQSRCRPEDLIVTWLHGCGFSIAELQKLLRISRHVPANAVKRVGQQVRILLGLSDEEVQAANLTPAPAMRRPQPPKRKSRTPHTSATPLELLTGKHFAELLEQLAMPQARGMLLSEAVAVLGHAPVIPAKLEERFAERRRSFDASGDWSWGLLTQKERRALFARNTALLKGAGFPDGGEAQRAALKKLVADLGNIFEELDSALEGDDLEWLLPIAEYLSPLLEVGGQFKEMRERYGVLLDAAQRLASPRLEFFAQMGLSRALWRLGDYGGAAVAGAAARELAVDLEDRQAMAMSLYRLGGVERVQGNNKSAQELYEQALGIMRSLGDRYDEANCLNSLGLGEVGQGNFSAARELLSQALSIYRSLGNRLFESFSLCNLGRVDFYEGNYNAARDLYEESFAIAQGLGNQLAEAWSLNGLAILEYTQGGYSAARQHCAQAHVLFRKLGNRENVAMSCIVSGAVLAKLGDLTAGAQILYGAQAFADRLGFNECPAGIPVRNDGLAYFDAAVASGQVSAADLSRWKAQGEAMSLEELTEFTLNLLGEPGERTGT